MSKLKCCPFCGSNKVKQSSKRMRRLGRRNYFQIYVYCQECNTYGPGVLIEDGSNIADEAKEAREKVIELWNSRIGG